MDQHIIQTFGLTRRFGNIVAVDQIDLRVPRGSVYSFLGPNGAGKTTTIRMLLGLIRPDAGKVALFGSALHEERLAILRRVGSLVETPSLYPHLTGWENLEVIRRMTGGKRVQIERALSIMHMEGDAHRRVAHYSTGMRQRLGLAIALLGQPDLLILDEPTNGLDPAGIHEIRELICQLPQQEGVTVFVSSHLLSEVEQMAAHVEGAHIGIIDRGKMIFQGTPDQLRARYQDHVSLVTDRLQETEQFLTKSGWPVTHGGNRHLMVQVNGLSDAAMLNAQLVQAGINVYHLSLEQPSLEDIFLALTNSKS
jgi:ABC-type multidrug transport system ATPase subunit